MSQTMDLNMFGIVAGAKQATQVDSEELNNGARITPRRAFGMKTTVPNNVVWVDETTIVYPVGGHIVSFDLDSHEMAFFSRHLNVRGCLAMALSANRKYLAVSEQTISPRVAQVSVYLTGRQTRIRTFSMPEAKEFHLVAFSKDMRTIACVTGGPHFVLSLWNWDKGTMIDEIKIGVATTQVTFNPFDAAQILVSGPMLLRLYKLNTESVLRVTHDFASDLEEPSFTSHLWLNKKTLVAASATGSIMLFHDRKLEHVFDDVLQLPGTIAHIVRVHQGFVAAASHGQLILFEVVAQDDGQVECTFVRNVVFDTLRHTAVAGLCPSPNFESVIVTMDTSMAYTVPISSAYLFTNQQPSLNAVPISHQSGAVIGLSVCYRRPLMVTITANRSLCVWNYIEYRCVLSVTLPGEPVDICMHPLGYQLVVSFAEGNLKVYSLLINEVALEHQLEVKQASRVSFSQGGQYFSVISDNRALIFNAFTFELLITLKGHVGPIKCLTWGPRDYTVVTCGLDGAVFEWSLKDYQRISYSHVKTTSYNGAAYTHESLGTVITTGSDKMLRELSQGDIRSEVAFRSGTPMTLLTAAKNRLLFIGTNHGAVSTVMYPLHSSNLEQEFHMHTGCVTRMAFSLDESFMYSCSDDGSLFISDVATYVDGLPSLPQELDASAFSDYVLVRVTDLEKSRSRIQDLQRMIRSAETEHEHQIEMKEQLYNQMVKKHQQQLELMKRAHEDKMEKLSHELTAHELKSADELRVLESDHLRAATELESLYERRLKHVQKNHAAYVDKTEDFKFQMEETIMKMTKEHKEEVEELNTRWEEAVDDLEEKLAAVSAELEEKVAYYESALKESEKEHDDEFEQLRRINDDHLQHHKDAAMTLKSEMIVMKRKELNQRNEMQRMQHLLESSGLDKTAQQKQIQELRNQVAMLQQELSERNDIVLQKEKSIFELKAKITELDKYRYVLDFKLDDMEHQFAPQERLNTTLKSRIKSLENELGEYGMRHDRLESALADKHSKFESLHKETVRCKKQLSEQKRYVRNFQQELHYIFSSGMAGPEWRKHLLEFYHKFSDPELHSQHAQQEVDSRQLEFQRQRQFLQQSLKGTRRKADREEKRLMVEHRKQVVENQELIGELNRLRKNQKLQAQKISRLQGENKSLQSRNAEMERAMERSRESWIKMERQVDSEFAASGGSGREVRDDGDVETTPGSVKGAGAGRLHKGSANKLWSEVSRAEQERMSELIQHLDENNFAMEQQQMEINRLREQIAMMLETGTREQAAAQEAVAAGSLEKIDLVQLSGQSSGMGGMRGTRSESPARSPMGRLGSGGRRMFATRSPSPHAGRDSPRRVPHNVILRSQQRLEASNAMPERPQAEEENVVVAKSVGQTPTRTDETQQVEKQAVDTAAEEGQRDAEQAVQNQPRSLRQESNDDEEFETVLRIPVQSGRQELDDDHRVDQEDSEQNYERVRGGSDAGVDVLVVNGESASTSVRPTTATSSGTSSTVSSVDVYEDSEGQESEDDDADVVVAGTVAHDDGDDDDDDDDDDMPANVPTVRVEKKRPVTAGGTGRRSARRPVGGTGAHLTSMTSRVAQPPKSGASGLAARKRPSSSMGLRRAAAGGRVVQGARKASSSSSGSEGRQQQQRQQQQRRPASAASTLSVASTVVLDLHDLDEQGMRTSRSQGSRRVVNRLPMGAGGFQANRNVARPAPRMKPRYGYTNL